MTWPLVTFLYSFPLPTKSHLYSPSSTLVKVMGIRFALDNCHKENVILFHHTLFSQCRCFSSPHLHAYITWSWSVWALNHVPLSLACGFESLTLHEPLVCTQCLHFSSCDCKVSKTSKRKSENSTKGRSLLIKHNVQNKVD